MKSENKLANAGFITAIIASLCCILPIVALILGTSGLASTFSWVEPFRPYLIELTLLVLGLAWTQKLKPRKKIDCECTAAEKPKFTESKKFLGIVTTFAIMMLALPYYSAIFYPNTEKQVLVIYTSDIKTTEFKIKGMTCESCETHVNFKVNKLSGIVNSKAAYKNGNAIVKFDSTKTNETEIEKAINAAGYKVTDKK
jgi:mercuric ion transport protein